MTWRSPTMLRVRLAVCLFGAALGACTGCGQPEAKVPAYDPEKAASDAFALYDTNKDGKLDAQELRKCPSLADGLSDLDKNNDKRIDRDELTDRLRALAESGAALFDVPAMVLRGGNPGGGVTVTLVPESFMGGVVQRATGVSADNGYVTFHTEGAPYPGVQPGFYRVELSRKEGDQEKMPAKYNTQTVLGRWISPTRRGRWEIRVED
jgi:hypothetical protein